MRVNNIIGSHTNFKRLLNNRFLLKNLEYISEHGSSFTAMTSLFMSLTARPLAIKLTPDTEKENKQYAIANSIGSGIIKFGMIEAVALPVENAMNNIDKNPSRFLKPATIKNLTGNAPMLLESKSYKLGAQILKLSAGFITAIPKSVLTVALIPVIMDKFFNIRVQKPDKKETVPDKDATKNKDKNITFNGNFTDKISSQIGKMFNNKRIQSFLQKFENDEANIAKHMTAATDILLAASSVVMTNHSKDIKENRKKALDYNFVVSTAATLILGYGIDKFVKDKTAGILEKFKQANIGDVKLHKYIDGINILRPALVFAGIYYGILPIASTYLAEKIDKFTARKDTAAKNS